MRPISLTGQQLALREAVTGIGNGQLVGAARLALGEYESGQIEFALRPDRRGHLYTRRAWRDSIVHSILSDEHDGAWPAVSAGQPACRAPGKVS